MKIILSPAKRLNEKLEDIPVVSTKLNFLSESESLIKILKKKSKSDISSLMKLSDALSELNYIRFQSWEKDKIIDQGKLCIYMFEGDAYKGMNVKTFSTNELEILNSKLFILSGLYGIIKPFDKILPYRLEMGTKLINKKGKNLYEFWGDKLTNYINNELKGEPLVNLASKEYSSVIDFSKLNSELIQVDFLQEKDDGFKNIAIFSKRARGLMTAYIAKNNIDNPEDLKGFDMENYYFNNNLSRKNHLVFSRIQ